jgi:hypothetical protein
VTDDLAGVPAPVHVRSNVVVTRNGPIDCCPLAALAPVHPPPAEQDVAPVLFHESVTVLANATDGASDVRATVAGGSVWTGGGGGVGSLLSEPQALSARIQRKTHVPNRVAPAAARLGNRMTPFCSEPVDDVVTVGPVLFFSTAYRI